MPRPINIQIFPENITHNLNVLKQRQTELHFNKDLVKHWAVVKANAYGHQIQNIYQGLCDAEIDGLALLDFKEATILRDFGWQKPILLLEGTFEKTDWQLVHQHQLISTIHSLYQLEHLQEYLTENPHFLPQIRKTGIFIKINTGMNRLGFKNMNELQSVIQQCQMLDIPMTLSTHFANADVVIDSNNNKILSAQKQWDAFITLKQQLLKLNDSISINNSVASFQGIVNIADIPEVEHIHNRYGIMMYGSSPFFPKQTAKSIGLKPTMVFTTKVIALLDVQKGEQVGYGSQFWAEKSMKIAIIACGYADGYPRHAPSGTPIAINGEKVRLIGRVSMDMITVDITENSPVQIGDIVELWGNIIDIDDVATHAQTIAYELMCGIAPRVWDK